MRLTLPLELQLEIIKLVYIASQAHDIDYATLSACALVCKSWTAVAQSLLFRRAPLSDSGAPHSKLNRLVRALSGKSPHRESTLGLGRANLQSLSLLVRALQGDSRLGGYVRALTIDVHANFSTMATDRRRNIEHLPRENTEAWMMVLKLCPCAEKLTFVGHRWQPGTVGMEQWSSKEMRSRLRKLAVRPRVLEFMDGFGGDSVRALQRVWPSVRWVTVHDQHILLGPSPISQTRMRRLVGLELRQSDDRFVGLDVLNGADGSLRELVLVSRTWWTWSGGEIAPALAARITSLTANGVPPAHILERFSSLEELILLTAEDSFIPPITIRHLGYHGRLGIKTAIYKVHAIHVAVAMSALYDLHLVTATRHLPQAALGVLQEACRVRDVDFVIYKDPDSFPREKNVDWI
ncbi:hypothetical protein FA95DRAFT_1561435 [Auriscalpium vulgare]|uniref:Uncharacterized protein n=1 Tax=Auriscalpium vulgare TaxID=40419 RepID=A0ACB8RLN0_9AGAM|nr:hypothetical protein FA95DRAFT_1561435 [Auriscalpium vulgare]